VLASERTHQKVKAIYWSLKSFKFKQTDRKKRNRIPGKLGGSFKNGENHKST
jgi:hypothetical protein